MLSSLSESSNVKRQVDLQIIADWIDPGSRTLDLGCGRGVLLEHLKGSRDIRGVGVDIDFKKILACIQRGLTAYQGDIGSVISEFPDNFFDWVICSRTLQELDNPTFIIKESLRVGRRMAVGFVNYAFWGNRLNILWHGSRISKSGHPVTWSQSRLFNPLSIEEFERFCEQSQLRIERRVYLKGDWRTPCKAFPNIRSAYALYAITR